MTEQYRETRWHNDSVVVLRTRSLRTLQACRREAKRTAADEGVFREPDEVTEVDDWPTYYSSFAHPQGYRFTWR